MGRAGPPSPGLLPGRVTSLAGPETGTAEHGTEEPLRTRTRMTGTRGDLTVAALVEDGASGSRTTASLLEQSLTGQQDPT